MDASIVNLCLPLKAAEMHMLPAMAVHIVTAIAGMLVSAPTASFSKAELDYRIEIRDWMAEKAWGEGFNE